MLKDQAPRGFQGIGYVGEINTSWWLKVLGLWLFFTRKESTLSRLLHSRYLLYQPDPSGCGLAL